MSVNAINTADVQPQKKNNAGGAVGAGIGLGAAGATAGYFFGGKTPSLEEVFAQEPDTFQASMAKAEKKDADAAKTLKDEMKAINEDADVKTKQAAADTKLEQVKNQIEAKKAKFDADDATKALRDEASKAVDELKTAKKGLIDRLKDKNNVTEAFSKIKKSLTEGKGKAAAIWGGIALAVGLIAGAVLGGKKEA